MREVGLQGDVEDPIGRVISKAGTWGTLRAGLCYLVSFGTLIYRV